VVLTLMLIMMVMTGVSAILVTVVMTGVVVITVLLVGDK
jgi:hypothetical protein